MRNRVMPNSAYSSMRQAFRDYDLQKVQQLVARGIDIDVRSPGGNTSLHWSVENNFVDGVRFLIALGANLDACNNKGWTPLSIAVQNNNILLATLLLEKGASVKAQDERSVTPLHIASTSEMVNLLLCHGADIY